MSVSSSLKQMTKAATRVLKTENEARESTDILETLKREHDEVKHLLSRLVKSDTAAERKTLVKQIKKALVPHTKAEEKVVYDAVIAVKDKQVQQDGYEGYLEHEWAAKTLQRLEGIGNANSPEHHAAAKVLKELVEHHIQEEESSVWADVRERFDDAQRLGMNQAFLAAKQRVKIH
jgi:hemerythrin superfamily protein